MILVITDSVIVENLSDNVIKRMAVHLVNGVSSHYEF